MLIISAHYSLLLYLLTSTENLTSGEVSGLLKCTEKKKWNEMLLFQLVVLESIAHRLREPNTGLLAFLLKTYITVNIVMFYVSMT